MAHHLVSKGAHSCKRKAEIRVLQHLEENGNYAVRDPLDDGRMVLVAGSRQPSTVHGTVHAGIVQGLYSDGALSAVKGNTAKFVLNESGRALLRRLVKNQGSDGFQAQHQMLRSRADGPDHQDMTVNDAESPLAWLRRRRNRDGTPMLDETRFIAGERLRGDMTRAQMLPRVTSNWSSAVASSARGATTLDPTDAMIAARQRVNRALAAVGPDLAGVLIDVCGFLKGLSDVEHERHWPARSGKVVLDIALGRLAAHFGLSQQAIGKGPAGQGIVAWAATDSLFPSPSPHPVSEAAS